MMQLSIVVVTHNSSGFIGPCLESLKGSGAEIIVVDNASTDTSKDIVKQFPGVKLIESDTNLGYGKAINLGAAQASGEYLILSNADVVYHEGAVSSLIALLRSDARIGIAAPQQLSPSGKWQFSYGDTPGIWTGIKDAVGINSARRWYRRLRWPKQVDRRPKEVEYVAGAVLALPREAYTQVRGFDEDFYFYSDESDLCIRLRRAGWKVVFCPFATIMHYGGGDSIRVDQSDKFYRFMTKSQTMLAKKHLPMWQARLYIWLEQLCFLRLALTFRIIKLLAGNDRRANLVHKIRVLDTHVRLFGEQLNELRSEEQ